MYYYGREWIKKIYVYILERNKNTLHNFVYCWLIRAISRNMINLFFLTCQYEKVGKKFSGVIKR